MRKSIVVIVALFASILAMPGGAVAQSERGVETALGSEIDALISEQGRSVAPVVVEGVALPTESKQDSVIVLFSEPSLEFLDAMQPGDGYKMLPVAAVVPDESGSFEFRVGLAEFPDVRAAEVERFSLWHYVDGQPIANGVVELEARGSLGGRDVATKGIFEGAASIDMNPGAPIDAESVEDDEIPIGEFVSGVEPTGGPVGMQELQGGGCDTVLQSRYHIVPATIAVVGTNTNTISYDVRHKVGTSGKFGFGINVGAGWIKGNGSYSRSYSGSSTIDWPEKGSYGAWAYRVELEYAKYKTTCYWSGGPSYTYEAKPLLYTGGSRNPSLWSSQYPTWCVSLAAGVTFTKDNSTATTWSAGAKLSWAVPSLGVGNLNASSQSGYSTKLTVKLRNESSTYSKWICGKNGWPAQSPGYIIGDWKDR